MYSEEKGTQPSINENKNHYDYEQEAGRRKPKRMPYEEPNGRDGSSMEC